MKIMTNTKEAAIDFLAASYPATEIMKAAHAAYYLDGAGVHDTWVRSQEDTIRRNFTDLAKALGYRVEPIEASLMARKMMGVE